MSKFNFFILKELQSYNPKLFLSPPQKVAKEQQTF